MWERNLAVAITSLSLNPPITNTHHNVASLPMSNANSSRKSQVGSTKKSRSVKRKEKRRGKKLAYEKGQKVRKTNKEWIDRLDHRGSSPAKDHQERRPSVASPEVNEIASAPAEYSRSHMEAECRQPIPPRFLPMNSICKFRRKELGAWPESPYKLGHVMNKLVKWSRKEQVVLYDELIELQTFLWKHLKYCKDRRRRMNSGKYGDSEREGID